MTADQPDQGAARGYSWQPFEPGHERSVQHGARSERRVGPLSEAIEADARASEAWPVYLRDASYGPAVRAWARAEATAELLFEFLAERDLAAAMTALESADETTTGDPGKGGSKRWSSTRRTTSALDAWTRATATAASLRRELGLTPASRGRLTRDVVAAQAIRAASLDALQESGRQALASRPLIPSAPVDSEASTDDE